MRPFTAAAGVPVPPAKAALNYLAVCVVVIAVVWASLAAAGISLNFDFVAQYRVRIWDGFCMTVGISAASLVLSLVLGVLVAAGQGVRFLPLRYLCDFYVKIIRGTPLMLQIIVIYLGPGLLGMANPWPSGSGGRMVAAVVAFAINYACYFSEIYRGGIEAVPKGQTEAGQVLGMTKPQIFFKVTLLQVIKRILPPMGNEIITLVKDTSLANTIANKEIIMMAKEYSAKGLIWPLFSTAIFFLVFVGALTLLFGWLEKKLDYFRC